MFIILQGPTEIKGKLLLLGTSVLGLSAVWRNWQVISGQGIGNPRRINSFKSVMHSMNLRCQVRQSCISLPNDLSLKGNFCCFYNECKQQLSWKCDLGVHCYPNRPIRKMVAANQHKLNFINQRNAPHHEKEHVKISNAAKFQRCRPKTRGMADI